MPSIELIIHNKVGLHARPANLFVQVAKKYKSDITVIDPNGVKVNGKSILGILSLGAGVGVKLEIQAEGEDGADALAEIKKLHEEYFYEKE